MKADTNIILNGNAKGTSPEVQDAFRNISHPRIREIYVSKTPEDAHQILEDVIKQGDRITYWRGGDGTLLHLGNILRNLSPKNMPIIAYAKGGTGNSIANFVRSTGTIDELISLLSQDQNHQIPIITIPLIHTKYQGPETQGETETFFASTGWDAQILYDYTRFKKRTPKFIHGVKGYVLSSFCLSIPKILTEKMQRPDITCHPDDPIIHYLAETDIITVFPNFNPQNTRLACVSVGSVPYYGYKFKAFPHLGRVPDTFNVRLIGGSKVGTILSLFANLPSIWSGEYQGDTFQDYFVKTLNIKYEHAVPLQIAGDDIGHVTSVDYTLSPEPLKVIDWNKIHHPEIL